MVDVLIIACVTCFIIMRLMLVFLIAEKSQYRYPLPDCVQNLYSHFSHDFCLLDLFLVDFLLEVLLGSLSMDKAFCSLSFFLLALLLDERPEEILDEEDSTFVVLDFDSSLLFLLFFLVLLLERLEDPLKEDDPRQSVTYFSFLVSDFARLLFLLLAFLEDLDSTSSARRSLIIGALTLLLVVVPSSREASKQVLCLLLFMPHDVKLVAEVELDKSSLHELLLSE